MVYGMTLLTMILILFNSFTATVETARSINKEQELYEEYDRFFHTETVNSFDGVLRAEINSDTFMIRIDIIDNESNEIVYSFEPVRKWDFWGICWERDNYNIWIDSGDVGIICYEYNGIEWIYNPNINIDSFIDIYYGNDK